MSSAWLFYLVVEPDIQQKQINNQRLANYLSMKLNKWTYSLASAGLISLGSAAHAEEAASQLLTALSGTQISGYASVSYVNALGADGPLVGRAPYAPGGGNFNDGFRLDVIGLSLNKGTTAGELSAGYSVNALIGEDALGYSDIAGIGSDEFTLQSAHLDLHAPVGNGLDLTLGHFDTIVGYEVVAPGANPNYTRSYGFFTEPFTHTGVKADYALNDMVSLTAGVANTNGGVTSINTRPLTGGGNYEGLTTLGAISIDLDDSAGALSGSNIYFAITNGTGDFGGGDITHYYSSLTLPTPAEGVDVGFSWDYSAQAVGYAAAYGIYATVAPADSDFSVNLRGEYANSNNGTFGLDGIDEDLFAITATLNYNLFENLLTRLEVRYDWDAAPQGFGSAGDLDDSQWLIALNAVYSF